MENEMKEFPHIDPYIDFVLVFGKNIVTEILRRGAILLPGFLLGDCIAELVERAKTLTYKPLPENNIYGVEQHMSSAPDVSGIPPFPDLAKEIGEYLAWHFDKLGYAHVGPSFDDICIQRYETCSIGISPHKDSKSHGKLIALLSLSGQAKFSICQERDIATATTTYTTMPGDLVLMRAPGFASPDDDHRPFHSVYEIEGPRYVLAMRIDNKEKTK